MSPSVNIRIHRVPKEAVPKCIRTPEVADLMAKGLQAAREENYTRVIAELLTDYRQLWLVMLDGEPVACWQTEIKTDASRVLVVSALSGRGLGLWVEKMSDAMTRFASKQGCECVRWAGRTGWGRAVPHAKAVATQGGETIYERAAA